MSTLILKIARKIHEIALFVLISLAIAAAFALLIESGKMTSPLQSWMLYNFLYKLSDDEAAGVLSRSAERESHLPAKWRQGAFELGSCIGFVTIVASKQTKSGADQPIDEKVTRAEQVAGSMGVMPVDWTKVRTNSEPLKLYERLEADETGLAGSIERQLSERHRHLFLAGVHVGAAIGGLEESNGEFFFIHYRFSDHARLAGVPVEAWTPLTRKPDGDTLQDKLAVYNAALETLERAVADFPKK